MTAARNEYFDASDKILLMRGWNHIEVKLPLIAASFQRNLALDRIREVVLNFDEPLPRMVVFSSECQTSFGL